MSKNDTKADLTSLPDVVTVPVSEKFQAHRATSEITATSGERRDSSDSQRLPGESLADDEITSSLSPETTSSELSSAEDTSEESRDVAAASPPVDAAPGNVEETIPKQKVCFAEAVTEISASLVSEDNESGYSLERDSPAVGTSGESTAQDAVAGDSESSTERSGEVNRGCCPEYLGPIGYFRISMMYLRESKYLLPFQFLLLSMPVSSGFMGAKYMEKCPASSAIPLLFFMMGILGTLAICARIYSIFKKALFPHSNWSGQVRSALVSLLLLILVLYTTELACFFNAAPDFTHGSDDYCDETFYTFVSYMNYISIALFIMLLLLHCPGRNPCTGITAPELFGEFD